MIRRSAIDLKGGDMMLDPYTARRMEVFSTRPLAGPTPRVRVKLLEGNQMHTRLFDCALELSCLA